MSHRTAPTNSDNVIDSRDIIARIEELERDREDLENAITNAKESLEDFNDPTSAMDEDEREAQQETLTAAIDALTDWDKDEDGQELTALKALAEEAEGYSSDWNDGATLIAASCFVDYCQELCADLGEIPKDLPSYLVIDWEATAENLKEDYTEVDFDGTTYLVR